MSARAWVVRRGKRLYASDGTYYGANRCAKRLARHAQAERGRQRRAWVAQMLWDSACDIVWSESDASSVFMRTGSLPAASRVAFPGRGRRRRA